MSEKQFAELKQIVQEKIDQRKKVSAEKNRNIAAKKGKVFSCMMSILKQKRSHGINSIKNDYYYESVKIWLLLKWAS